MSWTVTGVSAAPGLLDTYSGAAAAYSLRRLTWAYGGPVVRVRRSSDNTEQDFIATQVTDGTLTTFCGAGNGFVRTWYDQSGNNRNLEQSVASQQPQLVNNGVILTSSTKPILLFDGTNDSLRFTGPVPISANLSAFGIFTKITHVNNAGFFSLIPAGTTTRYDWASIDGRAFDFGVSSTSLSFTAHYIYQGSNGFSNNVSIVQTIVLGSPFVFSAFQSDGTARTRINGLNELSDTYGPGTPTNPDGIVVGGRFQSQSVSDNGNIRCQELILYGTNLYSSRSAIESNINTHYAIY